MLFPIFLSNEEIELPLLLRRGYGYLKTCFSMQPLERFKLVNPLPVGEGNFSL